jgi:hypothetical protein
MKLPAPYEAEAVDQIVLWFDQIEQKMTTEAAHRELRDYVREKWRSGAISRMLVVQAARDGDEDCHAALVALLIEMDSRGEEPPTELRAYRQEVLLQAMTRSAPPVSRPGGRNISDLWKRDVGIPALILVTMNVYGPMGLDATRGRATKRASACSLVSQALSRKNRLPLTERQVQKIYEAGLKDVARRLSERIHLQ